MNNKKEYILSVISKTFAIYFIIFANCLMIAAQSSEDSANKQLPSPAEEKFEEVDALASPWRIGDCPDVFYRMTNCHSLKGVHYSQLSRTSLYNEDGSLWYTYGNQAINPDYWRKNRTMAFMPFASYGDFQNNAILRMVGESKNWYKVEVNEKTRAIKFILKNDSHWEKTSWDFWLAKMMVFFGMDKEDKTKIYDKPNGNIVIGRAAESNPRCFLYLGKMESDWAYVQVRQGVRCYPLASKNEQGWIRWREGRKILVKHQAQIFNITELKTDAEN